jgi:hypothetical protein
MTGTVGVIRVKGVIKMSTMGLIIGIIIVINTWTIGVIRDVDTRSMVVISMRTIRLLTHGP